MSDSTFLHIQARGSSASRVMELTAASVRVGGGSHCEVRLPGTDSLEVLCVIRRRGEGWQVQPVGPAGRVALDGIPIERPRTWAPGTPLRVGEFRLTLHRPASEPGRVGSYHDPIAIIPESVETEPDPIEVAPEPEPSRATEAQESVDSQAVGSEEERLSRWQASLERRERWLKARREERKWEHRWRLAGERLRSRSRSGVADRPTTAPPSRPTIRPRPEPEVPPVPTAATSAPTPPRDEPTPKTRPDEARPRKLGAVTSLDGDSSQGKAREPTPDRLGPTRLLDSDTIDSTLAELITLLDPDDLAARLAWEGSGAEATVVEPSTAPPPRAPEPESRSTPTEWVEPSRKDRPAPLGLPAPGREPEAAPESSPRPLPAAEERVSEEPSWPSASAILEAHRTSASGSRTVRPVARARRRPTPTKVHRPGHWSLPAIWTVPPALALTLLIGGAGLSLAWTWTRDGRIAASLADRLLDGQAIPASGLETEPLPTATWWGTTANHLYWQAAAIGRIDGDPSRMDQARYLLGLAANASPLHPGVRSLQVSGLLGPDIDQEIDQPPIPPSRDILPLTQAARRAREEGRTEDALDAYRQAIVLAASADPAQAEPPNLDEGRSDRRALLPNEDLVLPILREFAEASEGDLAAWSSTLPDAPVILLAAYRVLRERGSTEAEPLLERLLALPRPIGRDLPSTIKLAARAEAEAFQERWSEAEQTYLKVIDQTNEAELRRVWWRNLAVIYARLDDLDRMETARANAETGAVRSVALATFLGRSESGHDHDANPRASE